MTVENKGTYRNKFTFYVPLEKKRILEKLKEILKREGKSVSQFILEQIEAYVMLHEPGNPQQLLERYVTHSEPYVAPTKCGFRSCNEPCVAIAVHKKTGYELPVCKFHLGMVAQERGWRIKDV